MTQSIGCCFICLLLLGLAVCRAESAAVTEAQTFIRDYEATVRPVTIQLSHASWVASISGKDEDFKKREQLQNKLDELLADKSRFAAIKRIREQIAASKQLADPLLARQVEVLYLEHLSCQVDPELLKKIAQKVSATEQKFNVHRATVDGKQYTNNEVQAVLRTSTDSKLRQRVWEASKEVGAVVLPDLKELVRLRNQAAKSLGFRHFYDMQLRLSEEDPDQLFALMDQLYELTRQPFKQHKTEIDAKLAANCRIDVKDLRPWHYHDKFFQEPPAIYDIDFDTIYAKADIVTLTQRFYAGIGLPIDKVIARSDLTEKPGKSPHAFCDDTDREGDIRVLMNVVPNHDWMGTSLHEFGHAVYGSLNMPATVPWVLREPAHSFTTEGIAMMFEGLASDADWMASMGVAVPDLAKTREIGAKLRRSHLLVFAAWSQVMVRFEWALYENPDQDLNKLWWDLVEKYQLVNRPPGRNAPDFASKIHICSSPCYYHNYTKGQLFACQLQATIAREVLKTEPSKAVSTGRKDVGEFLKTRVFAPANTLRWPALVRFATGEEMSAKAFGEEVK